MHPENDKPTEAQWRPLTGLPDGAENWTLPGYDEQVREWQDLSRQLTNKNLDKTRLAIWLRERNRAFAIENGQIEGLYTLKRGVTEQLITEGFDGAIASHTLENIQDDTLRGLLQDQEAALEMIFEDIKDNKLLTHYTIKSWHQLLTRHQETVTGLHVLDGRVRRVEIPFERKGEYKLRPNNPRRQDGVVHEYCPPEHVQSEMDRLLAHYEDIREREIATHVEAGWLHHRFVRTHPFQDGNGRVSRLLVAYAYLRRGEAPPIINANEKFSYITALEIADKGDMKPFCEHLGLRANLQLTSLINTTKQALDGNNRYRHGNGGLTSNGTYYPPENDSKHDDEVELEI